MQLVISSADHENILYSLLGWIASLILYVLMLMGSLATFLSIVRRGALVHKIAIGIHVLSLVCTSLGLLICIALDIDKVVLSLNAYSCLVSFLALIQTIRAR